MLKDTEGYRAATKVLMHLNMSLSHSSCSAEDVRRKRSKDESGESSRGSRKAVFNVGVRSQTICAEDGAADETKGKVGR